MTNPTDLEALREEIEEYLGSYQVTVAYLKQEPPRTPHHEAIYLLQRTLSAMPRWVDSNETPPPAGCKYLFGEPLTDHVIFSYPNERVMETHNYWLRGLPLVPTPPAGR